MSSVVSKYGTLLVFVVLALVFAVVSGCSDTFTTQNSTDSRGTNLKSHEEHNQVDELWVISSRSETRSNLTVEQIKEILEANSDRFTTADGEIDDELLRQFVIDYFDYVEVVIGNDEIDEILRRIETSSGLKPNTKTIKVTIVVKNK